MDLINKSACYMLVAVALTGCERSTAPTDDDVIYANEYGEEVFGPDYLPASPAVSSVPLILGTPNAGWRLPSDFVNRTHESVPRQMQAQSASGIENAAVEGLTIPYLKGVPVERSLVEPQSIEIAPMVAPMAIPDGDSEDMVAHFVFVGQGDGTILEFPCGVAVIDTGGGYGAGEKGADLFLDYLKAFFADRPHYNDTIDVLITTHPHADHLNGLRLIQKSTEPAFVVKNFVDNGQTNEKGGMAKQTKFREWVIEQGGEYAAVRLARQRIATGATNHVIDPINCTTVDPIITAFWGGIDMEIPEEDVISSSPYGNPNNHSVVVRVDYGEASFLFTGDLEDTGEEDLRAQYEDNLEVFDVDIYQVSHHGAELDTSNNWLSDMTPDMAVISMGRPDVEKPSTAWAYGHPRTKLLAKLQNEPGIVSDERDPPETFWGFPERGKISNFVDVEITQAVFGTGWEGTVVIEASAVGEYDVFAEGFE